MNEPGNCGEIIGETVRRLGTIIQTTQSGASVRLTVWKWSCESRYPGALPPVLETFVAPFLPAQLTAPGSPRMNRGEITSFPGSSPTGKEVAGKHATVAVHRKTCSGLKSGNTCNHNAMRRCAAGIKRGKTCKFCPIF